jgi:hypothetical protein
MNKTYLFTDSYRKKEVKFPSNLLNEGKAKFPRVDCCFSRASMRRGYTAYRAVSTDYKRFLKATSQVRRLMLVVASSKSFPKLPTTSGDCLNVGTRMRLSPVVDFDPVTADMAPGTRWHPYHALSTLCNSTSLGRWLELEI